MEVKKEMAKPANGGNQIGIVIFATLKNMHTIMPDGFKF